MRTLLLLLALTLPTPVLACVGLQECPGPPGFEARGYHVVPPEGWDGATPLPVMLHFHGWGRQGETIVNHPRIAGATRPRGVLLVAPDGLGRSWDFRAPGSRDTSFATAVLAEVAARYPTDGRLFVSGYSWGALMAARFACEGPAVEALLLVAGAFPGGMACDATVGRVSHVHGTDDTVLGFPYGPDGEETAAVDLWRRDMGCGVQDRSFKWQAVSWLTHTRHEWDCAAGLVTMDVHPASHLIPRGWFARILDEVLAAG
ncbi:polyhydroxybutyrate depolymerase [Jannaschia sp. Os4]|uniref:alpha/beta hydrolase family esterase n=1 Tax=Jannaschia sp. Os4 TaxID=2807617 RepID=UPI001939CF5F|nr:polyhydroxybutyrate depolymerase [Jannaschia sp. Os4]MBM2577412.1 polyhydroxybutyrate depolymerase [Jannaschia sp. Os4]